MSRGRNVTPWFPVAVDPEHEGIYEVEYRHSAQALAWFDGARANDAEGPAMSDNKPLRRGVDGVCTRSTCECEREGLGDQCVWLKPADRPPTPVGWSDTDWLKHLEEIR